MPRQNFETLFKSEIVDYFHGFSRRIEPGRGGDSGFPDLILGTTYGLVPAEVKLGSISDGVLWTSNIRPSQLKFAREISAAGFPSIFLVGVQTATGWRCFAFNAVLAPQFDTTGFAIDKDCFELNICELGDSLDDFIFREFGL